VNITLSTYIDGQPWGSQYRADIVAIRDAAVLGVNAHEKTWDLFWDSATSSWPAIPAAAAGRIIVWWSLHDAAATNPPVSTVNFIWFKKL